MVENIRKRLHRSPIEKANIVLYCLASNSSIESCCKDFGIAVSSYYCWKNTFINGGISALKNRKRKSSSKKLKQLPKRNERTLNDIQAKFIQSLKSEVSFGPRYTADSKTKIVEFVEYSEVSASSVLKALGIAKSSFYRWKKELNENGGIVEYRLKSDTKRKYEQENIKDVVFKVFHSPPSDYGFNRTTWRMVDLQEAIAKEGSKVGLHTIRKVIKAAGFRWMKAKKVITSADPEYREKVDKIYSILGNLEVDEGFFSIDEYGPFAIKHKQGRKLVKAGEPFTVPQWQKSKGCLIMTAALELATNQVTHFYSDKKDTEEMIKLLDILLSQYGHLKKIYLSWDAASWHISKKLFEKIENNNVMARITGSTYVEVAPLPAGAQFLNVIEAVFSGMSRAIIHNSDYKSVKEAKNAIDLYFSSRNQAFKEKPQRAGKKIWGKEPSPCYFNESKNSKDPRYR